jgi:hypothetical protein
MTTKLGRITMRGGPRNRVKIDDPSPKAESILISNVLTGESWRYKINAERTEAVYTVPERATVYVGDQAIDGMNTDDDEGPDDLLGPADFEDTDYCLGTEGPDYYDEEE